VDSLWDSVHTVIRPLGGALLAVTALGNPSPVYEAIVAVLAAAMSFSAHAFKAGIRLTANSAPSPFSSIALSLGEDVVVFGGLALIAWNPLVALAVFTAIFLAFIWLFPIMFRIIRVKVWLAWRKLQQPAQLVPVEHLPNRLPRDCEVALQRIRTGSSSIAWAVRVISGRGKEIPFHRDGWLAGVHENPSVIYFLAKKMFSEIAYAVDLTGCTVSHDPQFLEDDLIIFHPSEGWKCTFIFDRPRNPTAGTLCSTLTRDIAAAGTAKTPGEKSSFSSSPEIAEAG